MLKKKCTYGKRLVLSTTRPKLQADFRSAARCLRSSGHCPRPSLKLLLNDNASGSGKETARSLALSGRETLATQAKRYLSVASSFVTNGLETTTYVAAEARTTPRRRNARTS